MVASGRIVELPVRVSHDRSGHGWRVISPTAEESMRLPRYLLVTTRVLRPQIFSLTAWPPG
jgi:hypothetical protein